MTVGSASTTSSSMLAEHHAALAAFIARAEDIPASAWHTPRAPKKWSPAQEVKHVALAYEAFARDLNGGAKIRLKGKPWQRLLWRVVALRRILRTRRIPRPVRAPKEIRPPDQCGERPELLAELRGHVAAFEAAFERAWTTAPGTRLTHPFFGGLSLRDAARFVAVHTEHHTRFLDIVLARSAASAAHPESGTTRRSGPLRSLS